MRTVAPAASRAGAAGVALAVMAVSAPARADSSAYEQVRVDAGLTGSWVGVHGRNGSGMVVEIKGQVGDRLAVGGRVEVAVMFGGALGRDELPLQIAMAACGLAKAELHLADGLIRPFVGLGAGGYTVGAQSIDSGPNTTGIERQTGRYLGVAPQLGVDLGPVRLAATYNAILGASLEVRETVGGVEQVSRLSQNYLSLELSYRFTGGPRRPAAAP